MKRGHRNLLIFELIMFAILIINSFVWNMLESYTMIIFLITTIIVFKKIFGIEKDRHRYIKDVIFDTAIFILTFFLLYYLSGIIIGFARTDNYYNWYGLVKFIIPLVLTIITKEYLRYQVIMKSEGSKLLTIISCMLFILLDVTTAIYYSGFSSKYDAFLFIALTLLPAISTNIVCCYLTYKVGYKPNIMYLLVMNLYQYLLPIVPNPNEYIASIIMFVAPIVLGYKLNKFFTTVIDEDIARDYRKNRMLSLIIPTLIVIVLVYFNSGYFKYHAIAIASGSMEKQISKGDVVIIEKVDGDYASLKEGQIIAYKHDGVIVVHRLIKIIKEDNRYFFYTKGDANADPDNYVIEQSTVIGKVNVKIPFIGLPTVWLNEL